MSQEDSRKLSQERFSLYAENYVSSAVHAQGRELIRLLEMANPERDWLVMDVATGGGHTALTFAPYVRQVVAADISISMLQAARRHLNEKGQRNLTYLGCEAARLPFEINSFDLITCRVAPHHFTDCFAFIQECTRVLKPGRVLVIQDHVLPENERDAHYLEAFERLRDPSHHRAFSMSEWRGMFLDAGLTVEHSEIARQRDAFFPWCERQGCTPYVTKRLEILLAQAPQGVREWMNPRCVGTTDASFEHVYVLIAGRKPLA